MGDFSVYPCTGRISTVVDEVSAPYVALAFVASEPRSGRMQYAAMVKYSGSAWLFISPGPSLQMLVDGSPLTLSSPLGSSESQTVSPPPIVSDDETATYFLTPEQLARVAGASRIQFRVSGQDGYVEGCVLERQIPEISTFIARTSAAK